MAVQQYVVNPTNGIFTDDKGNPVDAVTIYASTAVIKDVGGVATGIPTKQWEHGFVINMDNFDIYTMRVSPTTGKKEWRLAE